MSEYEDIIKSMTLTPEEEAARSAQSKAYLAKIEPVFDKLRAGEITKDEALDLLTEIKGGGERARFFAGRLLARSSIGKAPK
jgi:hypothetical protein